MHILKLKQWNKIPVMTRDGEIKIDLSTKSLIKQVLNNVGEGITPTQMADRVKILLKIDKCPESAKTISFEDAEFATIKQCEAAIKWSFVNACFVEFHDDLLNAEKK